eukprot:Platyproteum_vivax@DN6714_c0_g1_i1.p1
MQFEEVVGFFSVSASPLAQQLYNVQVEAIGVVAPQSDTLDTARHLIQAGASEVWQTLIDFVDTLIPACKIGSRAAESNRQSKETSVRARVAVDGTGRSSVNTGVGFLDHMIDQLAKHGSFDIELQCAGDLHIDDHHTVEDCAITLGDCFHKALQDRKGVVRFGSAYAPLDEALSRVVVDLSGRGHSDFNCNFLAPKVGALATEMVPHFFMSFAHALHASIHVDCLRGVNEHHKVESIFKALALALKTACVVQGASIPSTKGTL